MFELTGANCNGGGGGDNEVVEMSSDDKGKAAETSRKCSAKKAMESKSDNGNENVVRAEGPNHKTLLPSTNNLGLNDKKRLSPCAFSS